MKKTVHATFAAALLTTAAMLAGCGDKAADQAAVSPSPAASATGTSTATTTATTPAVATGKPLGTLKVGGRAVCAVCAVKEGTKETEEVKAVLDYKGKTYGFCDEAEKAEFISAPTKYAQAQ